MNLPRQGNTTISGKTLSISQNGLIVGQYTASNGSRIYRHSPNSIICRGPKKRPHSATIPYQFVIYLNLERNSGSGENLENMVDEDS